MKRTTKKSANKKPTKTSNILPKPKKKAKAMSITTRATAKSPPEDALKKAENTKSKPVEDKHGKAKSSDPAPTRSDDTNAESSMDNYRDAGGDGGVSAADEASEGKVIPDRTLTGYKPDTKKPTTKLEKAQAKQGATEEQIAAQQAYESQEAEYAGSPQISRTYDGEEDVAAVQKRRNAERQYKQAGKEIPEHTGYVFLDSRPKQENLGAGEEVSQGQKQTKETIKKEDANVENR